MPVITGVGAALRSLYRVYDTLAPTAERQADGDPERGYPEVVRRTTEYADAVSISDELESLALELRDPAGKVVSAESIYINDTEYLLALAREPLDESELDLPPELEEEIEREVEEMLARERDLDPWESDDDEPWKPSPPMSRYQIIVISEDGFPPP